MSTSKAGLPPTATRAQIAAIMAMSLNDTARAMAEHGVRITWSQHDKIGEQCLDWLKKRLGLVVETDCDGILCTPMEAGQ